MDPQLRQDIAAVGLLEEAPFVAVHHRLEQDRAGEPGLETPHGACRLSARSAMSRARASADVAAGEGALRTWRARSVSETTKSSTSLPSRARAWARTPAKPPSKSSGRISGTYSAAAAASARRLIAWRISVRPVRHQRLAIRHVPGQASVDATSRGCTRRSA